MTLRGIWLLRYLLMIPGVSLYFAGVLLAVQTAFATRPFVAGLALHLFGLALCLIGLRAGRLAAWLGQPAAIQQALQGRQFIHDTALSRPAHFRLSTQLIRLMLGMILLGSSIALPAIALRQLGRVLALQRQGVQGDAQIFNKVSEAELSSANIGTVYYAFRVNSTLVTGEFRALRADYPRLRTGNHLKVTYLPTDPQIHLLGVVDRAVVRQRGMAILLLLVTGLNYVWLPIVSIERRLRRQLRLARCGVLVTGTITGCRPVGRRGQYLGYRVRYEFALSSGVPVAGSAFVPHLPGEPTLIGFPIGILYDARWPWYHRPLASLHQVALDRMPTSTLAV